MDTPDSDLKIKINEVSEVRYMCKNDFNGYWQLSFLPYEGGYYDQPALELDRITLIVGCVNQQIEKKKDKKGGK